MQPFNLEKALRGAKLVTRKGDKVTGFVKKKHGSSFFPYEYFNDTIGAYMSVSPIGRYNIYESGDDLFLADPEPTPEVMTAKMQAEQIVGRIGKEHALYAIQLIINSNPHSNPLNSTPSSTLAYWEEVRREVEKL